MRSVQVRNLSNNQAILLNLSLCDNFFSRLKGLMFTKVISSGDGVLFINDSDDRINSAIHMFFMEYDLSIIWIDSYFRVVDKIMAKRWHTIAAPCCPAKFIMEISTDKFENYQTGDLLEFNYG